MGIDAHFYKISNKLIARHINLASAGRFLTDHHNVGYDLKEKSRFLFKKAAFSM